ncbi:MAG: DUF5320 domain-containing protein [Snowella sp.]|nr:DUF5320 domain-containing protein [Snowella sp.]
MTSQQLKPNTQDLEQRVKILENELEQIKKQLSQSTTTASTWWLNIAGSFEQDPTFDEVVLLGEEWRKTAHES